MTLRTSRQGACLIWTGNINRGGYGTMVSEGKFYTVHRFVWQEANGPIPDGMQIDHLCHRPACCELSHLRLTNAKENLENLKGPKRNNKSGIRGVSWRSDVNKWAVQVMHNRKNHRGGYFTNLQDAEAAAQALRNELFTHNDLDRR